MMITMLRVYGWGYGKEFIMPQGLQVYDANGVLINDTNDRFPRIMGKVTTTAGTNGSLNINVPAGRVPIFFMVGLNAGVYDNLPYATISNSQLAWQYRRYSISWGTFPYAAAVISWGYY